MITQDMIDKVGKKFAHALLEKDNETLNSIVSSGSGKSGSSGSNVTDFRKANPQSYLGGTPLRNRAILAFGTNQDQITCIVDCKIADGKISGDWKVLK